LVLVFEKQRVSLQLESVPLLHVHKHGRGQRRHGVGQAHENATQLRAGFRLVPAAHVSWHSTRQQATGHLEQPWKTPSMSLFVFSVLSAMLAGMRCGRVIALRAWCKQIVK
jgi:hypothetical protein